MNVKYFKTSGDTSWIRLQLRKTYRNFFIYLRHTGIAVKWLLFKFKCIKFFNALKVSGRANKRLFSNVSQRNLTKRSMPAGRASRKFPLNPSQKNYCSNVKTFFWNNSPNVSRCSQFPISSGNVQRPVLLHHKVSNCVSWPISRGNDCMELQLKFKDFKFINWHSTKGNSFSLL